MEIWVNGKPTQGLSAKEVGLIKAKAGPRDAVVEGVVLTAEEASRRVRIAGWALYGALGALAAAVICVLLVAAVLDLAEFERVPVVVAALLCAAFVFPLLLWAYRRSIRQWQERLAERVTALPAPGAPVRLTADGVTLGHYSAHWQALTVARLELDRVALQDGDGHVYLIERILLADGARPIALERNLMSNGKAIVEAAYVRLIGEPS